MKINDSISIEDHEYEVNAIRASGAGGQNVNKVSSAIHLRFNINASSLPDDLKQRLLSTSDHRINSQGILVIKAQNHRRQDKNLLDAIERLKSIIAATAVTNRKRIATKPRPSTKRKRLDNKTRHGNKKALRSKANYRDE